MPGKLQGGLSISFERETIKGVIDSELTTCPLLALGQPSDPHRAFAIISPTFQMMKSRFKEAKNSEIPQLMWQSGTLTTPSGFRPLPLTTRLNCLQMSFKHESKETHHQHPGVHHTPPSSPAW